MRSFFLILFILLLAPVWIGSIAICLTLLLPTFLLGQLPRVGDRILDIGLKLCAPLLFVWQLVALAMMGITKEAIVSSTKGVQITFARRVESFAWEDILRIERRLFSPFFQYIVQLSDGSQIELNPCCETNVFIAECEARSICVQEVVKCQGA